MPRQTLENDSPDRRKPAIQHQSTTDGDLVRLGIIERPTVYWGFEHIARFRARSRADVPGQNKAVMVRKSIIYQDLRRS